MLPSGRPIVERANTVVINDNGQTLVVLSKVPTKSMFKFNAIKLCAIFFCTHEVQPTLVAQERTLVCVMWQTNESVDASPALCHAAMWTPMPHAIADGNTLAINNHVSPLSSITTHPIQPQTTKLWILRNVWTSGLLLAPVGSESEKW